MIIFFFRSHFSYFFLILYSIDHENYESLLSYCSTCRCYSQNEEEEEKKTREKFQTTLDVHKSITITFNFREDCAFNLEVSVNGLEANLRRHEQTKEREKKKHFLQEKKNLTY